MNKKVVLLCGVSGAGKTWVCKQVTDKYNYVPHDEHYSDLIPFVKDQASKVDKPIITESPFGERIVREQLEKEGFQVDPVFIIEKPSVVAKRYYEREKKTIQQSALTRAKTIVKRADEWKAPRGTSEEILKLLKKQDGQH